MFFFQICAIRHFQNCIIFINNGLFVLVGQYGIKRNAIINEDFTKSDQVLHDRMVGMHLEFKGANQSSYGDK